MSINTIVWFVFASIIFVCIIAALWWLIGYCEQNMPMPQAWKIVRVVFVILCVFFLITVLLHLLGFTVVTF